MADDLAKLTKHEFPALTRELNRFVRTLYQTKIIKKSEIAVTQEKIRTNTSVICITSLKHSGMT
jgi:hypothetical protein